MQVSDERILELFAGRARTSLTPAMVLRELGGTRKQGRVLRRSLDRLVQRGRLERAGRRYRAPRRDGLVEGALHQGGVLDDAGELWAAPESDLARSGDRVLLAPIGDPRRRRGEVVGVVDAPRDEWVGILERRGGEARIRPYRDDARWQLRVAARDCGRARHGDVVVAIAKSKSGSGGRGMPSAVVVERLGRPGTPEADFRAVVWRRRLPVEFPAEVLAEAEAAAALGAREIARRVDLRDRPFLTIDPASARDHDDAVFVDGERRLFVAIADVSNYVPRGSALDRESLQRGNSVYFPDRAIPMLPERLSGELCSLVPDADRAAIVAELLLDEAGAVVRRSFYPAVIRSRARLDYADAAAVMEGRRPEREVPAEVGAPLRALAELAARLRRRRLAAGAIDLELPEARIVLDEDGRAADVVEAPRTVAHRAIEEAMLAANRAVADFVSSAGAAAVYRIHEAPSASEQADLRQLLASQGLLHQGRGDAVLGPGEIARALERARGRPVERQLHWVALRSMRRARYHAENRGHFALAFDSYLHFTSPIRRYADLVVHRALVEILEGGARATAFKRVEKRDQERMSRVAARLSQRERAAVEAERESTDLAICAFMARHVGGEFEGTVASVARHGFYVRLDDFAVEGLVPAAALPGRFRLDERTLSLVARSGSRFQLGDRVRIRVERVDQLKAWITFGLLSHGKGNQSAPSRRASSSSARRSQSR
ncbi:MAG: VacB/RNase II family 3'-5' exoribonuclease [Proteobacteria bacterium]|nr:VacB/RNase II family 3'-5' exoribonuclease [Pseudomonadota bacterium]